MMQSWLTADSLGGWLSQIYPAQLAWQLEPGRRKTHSGKMEEEDEKMKMRWEDEKMKMRRWEEEEDEDEKMRRRWEEDEKKKSEEEDERLPVPAELGRVHAQEDPGSPGERWQRHQILARWPIHVSCFLQNKIRIKTNDFTCFFIFATFSVTATVQLVGISEFMI